jgi:hypothetical protein
MSSCIESLKSFIGDELKSKLGDVLKDATDASPAGLAQKVLGQSQKSQDTKAVVSGGVQSFKNRMGLPAGRLDGPGGLNLGEIKQKADALKAKAQAVQSAVADFQSQFPGCALDPDVLQTINTVASIDTKLNPLSMIDTAKLDGEIAAAQTKIDEATDMQAQSARLQDLFGVSL